jgi:NADH-quinone oxidoreductase subunit N
VVISVVAAFFYIRVIVLMFFTDPVGPVPAIGRPGFGTLAAVGVGVVATVALGVFPGPMLALAQQASEFMR